MVIRVKRKVFMLALTVLLLSALLSACGTGIEAEGKGTEESAASTKKAKEEAQGAEQEEGPFVTEFVTKFVTEFVTGDDVIYNENTPPLQALIRDFPVIRQYPELPSGCEIVAMTMIINYYGYPTDKMTMAMEYLPMLPYNVYYGEDGILYGNDMENYFIGDPRGTGYICGPSAIVTAADNCLSSYQSNLIAKDITGASPEELYELISQDIPVEVWITKYMENRISVHGWYTKGGEYMEWSPSDHSAVLIGYGEDTVIIADPISGLTEYDRQQFEKIFTQRGNRCVILQRNSE